MLTPLQNTWKTVDKILYHIILRVFNLSVVAEASLWPPFPPHQKGAPPASRKSPHGQKKGQARKFRSFILQLVGGLDDYLFSMETDCKKLVSRVKKKKQSWVWTQKTEIPIKYSIDQ